MLDPNELDSFLAVDGDGTVTLFCGKVDLGQGLRIAMRQIAGEELGIGVDKIKYVEGDTALTPDQGRTSGSNGIQRGGMQIRRAAATAREALWRLPRNGSTWPPMILLQPMARSGRRTAAREFDFADLIGGRSFDLKLNPKAPLKNPATYTLVGKPLPRPDVPAKCTGTSTLYAGFQPTGHAACARDPPAGDRRQAHLGRRGSIKDLPGAKVVRIKNFLAVVAEDEWTGGACRPARCVRNGANGPAFPSRTSWSPRYAAIPDITDEVLVNRGGPRAAAAPLGAKTLSATYFWPMQSHASIGPSCAVADVSSEAATIWTASQGTHGNRTTFARFLGLPEEKVRLDLSRGRRTATA